ncbi:transglutaminase-like domain-containing protein [Spirosoma spitsbergense]|uniref:transglutaminase-like domain-containing protein n=1 Tax=Spirosoma spitsbergense TaxID=431554 RepID=UPI0012F8C785|nr:transglutaminase domain-containing protein [Spirosoma spitsbergense]
MHNTILHKHWRPLLLAGLLQGVSWLATALPAFTSPAPPRNRKVQLVYKTTIGNVLTGTKKLELWIPVPHNNLYQQISDLTITSPYPYKLDTAQYGNQFLHLLLKNPPAAGFVISMQFTAVRKERISQIHQSQEANVARLDSSDKWRWLQPDRLVPIDGKIKELARQVVDSVGAKTDMEQARAIYDHVIATVKYDKTGTGWGRGDIYYACDVRRGNCTDFHAIFIGYCRALGIPARFAIGVSLPADRPGGQISGYHCWAEFYSKTAGWVPIDASEAAKNPEKRSYYFGAHDENRVEFSVGRDLLLYPRQEQPLNYFIYPYGEVDGKLFSLANPIVTYIDLNDR